MSRRGVAIASGCLVSAVGVFVGLGMVGGADPTFSRGRSSTQSIVVQEVFGGIALLALVVTLREIVLFAQGKYPSRFAISLAASMLLALGWWYALAVERAS
jgi:hypothetical protein